MRVIAGRFKGKRIEAPHGEDVRPTSDKVKEAIFSMIMNDIPESCCVDLFAGTGALGIEALSRGATKCLFCDSDRKSISYIRRNIKSCGIEENFRIVEADYMKVLRKIDSKYDLFFIDPPYNSNVYLKCLETIDRLDLLSDEGIIVTEHDKTLTLPESVGLLKKYKEKTYGKIQVSLFYKAEGSI